MSKEIKGISKTQIYFITSIHRNWSIRQSDWFKRACIWIGRQVYMIQLPLLLPPSVIHSSSRIPVSMGDQRSQSGAGTISRHGHVWESWRSSAQTTMIRSPIVVMGSRQLLSDHETSTSFSKRAVSGRNGVRAIVAVWSDASSDPMMDLLVGVMMDGFGGSAWCWWGVWIHFRS